MEVAIQTAPIGTTTQTRQLKAFADVLTTWLQKWARQYSLGRREPIRLTEDEFAIYAEALSGGLTPEQLDAACLKAAQTCEFFPQPADIRKHIKEADADAGEIEAEDAWQRVLEYVEGGCWSKVRVLSTAERHALGIAGGRAAIERCDTHEDLNWIKKRFIPAFLRYVEVESNVELLTDGQAKKLIAQIANHRDLRALPPARSDESQPKGRPLPLPAFVDNTKYRSSLPKCSAAPDPTIARDQYVAPPECELSRRAADQKRRFEEWQRMHPVPLPKNPISERPQVVDSAEAPTGVFNAAETCVSEQPNL